MRKFFNFNSQEIAVFRKLGTPQKIQDFLNELPVNFEENGDTCLSPRQVLKQHKAHCVEGALLAAVALWYHGKKPLLMDLKTAPPDDEHVVALFKQGGRWGALSKTNHAVLRYREPVYKTVRELAMSYFHEYFNDRGEKTLRSYSRPLDLSKINDRTWLTEKDNLWDISDDLDAAPHCRILTAAQIKNLRLADSIEIKAGKLVEQRPGK
jgi:hypothetical protein